VNVKITLRLTVLRYSSIICNLICLGFCYDRDFSVFQNITTSSEAKTAAYSMGAKINSLGTKRLSHKASQPGV